MNLTIAQRAAIVFPLSLCPLHDARAELAICNQTAEISNIAIGSLSADGEPSSQGWWTIPPNRCETIVRDLLKTRYIYVYATDVKGRPLISGSTLLCVGIKKFSAAGAQSCWMRGYDRAAFAEIDTGSSPSWTVFLSGR